MSILSKSLLRGSPLIFPKWNSTPPSIRMCGVEGWNVGRVFIYRLSALRYFFFTSIELKRTLRDHWYGCKFYHLVRSVLSRFRRWRLLGGPCFGSVARELGLRLVRRLLTSSFWRRRANRSFLTLRHCAIPWRRN